MFFYIFLRMQVKRVSYFPLLCHASNRCRINLTLFTPKISQHSLYMINCCIVDKDCNVYIFSLHVRRMILTWFCAIINCAEFIYLAISRWLRRKLAPRTQTLWMLGLQMKKPRWSMVGVCFNDWVIFLKSERRIRREMAMSSLVISAWTALVHWGPLLVYSVRLLCLCSVPWFSFEWVSNNL